MPPNVVSSISATGGCISLEITLGDVNIPGDPLDPYTTQITIYRYIGSLTSTATLIYSGPLTPVFLDSGETLPSYLDFATPVFYKVTDPTGTTTVGPITPAAQLDVLSTYLDKLLFRLFSAGISAVAVPAGFNKVRVLQALPLTMASEATKFPFIVMNLDLEQQEFTQIGEDVLTSDNNINVIPIIVNRRYSISVLCQFAEERNFYKDACIGVLYAMMPTLSKIGQDYSWYIQAANSQVSEGATQPGFYESTIMLDFNGMYNISINTNYGLIEFIDPNFLSTNVTGAITTFQI